MKRFKTLRTRVRLRTYSIVFVLSPDCFMSDWQQTGETVLKFAVTRTNTSFWPALLAARPDPNKVRSHAVLAIYRRTIAFNFLVVNESESNASIDTSFIAFPDAFVFYYYYFFLFGHFCVRLVHYMDGGDTDKESERDLEKLHFFFFCCCCREIFRLSIVCNHPTPFVRFWI